MPSVYHYKTSISWVREKKLCTFIPSFSLLMLGALCRDCGKMKKFILTVHTIALYLLSHCLLGWYQTLELCAGSLQALVTFSEDSVGLNIAGTHFEPFKRPSRNLAPTVCSSFLIVVLIVVFDYEFLSYFVILFVNFQATEKYLAEHLICN